MSCRRRSAGPMPGLISPPLAVCTARRHPETGRSDRRRTIVYSVSSSAVWARGSAAGRSASGGPGGVSGAADTAGWGSAGAGAGGLGATGSWAAGSATASSVSASRATASCAVASWAAGSGTTGSAGTDPGCVATGAASRTAGSSGACCCGADPWRAAPADGVNDRFGMRLPVPPGPTANAPILPGSAPRGRSRPWPGLPLGEGLDELVLGVTQVDVELVGGARAVAALQLLEDLPVAREVGLVEPLRVGHHVEHQPQLGEDAAHQLVRARAARQRHELLVEL